MSCLKCIRRQLEYIRNRVVEQIYSMSNEKIGGHIESDVKKNLYQIKISIRACERQNVTYFFPLKLTEY